VEHLQRYPDTSVKNFYTSMQDSNIETRVRFESCMQLVLIDDDARV
jgi:hypothetical protein